MNKICTSIEQSQKLIELGIDINTADMYYCYGMDIHTKKWDYDIVPTIIDAFNQIDISDIPAWSLSTLFNMLPKSARLEKGSSTELCRVNLPVELKCSDWYLDPIDAAFEMVVWLKENGND